MGSRFRTMHFSINYESLNEASLRPKLAVVTFNSVYARRTTLGSGHDWRGGEGVGHKATARACWGDTPSRAGVAPATFINSLICKLRRLADLIDVLTRSVHTIQQR